MATGGKIVKVTIKLDDQITRYLKRIETQLTRLESVANNTNRTMDRVGQIGQASFNQLSTGISNATSRQTAYTNSIIQSLSPMKQLVQTVRTLVATYMAYNGVESIIKTSDAVTQSTARLSLFNDGLKSTEELTNDIFEAAQRSRGSYLDMMDLVSKYSAVASKNFKGTQDVIAFSESLQKMFIVSGASGQEIYSASLQLKQALGSGRLMGEEFRAVMEAAPLFGQALSEYMTNMGVFGEVAIGDLKELASESKITSDIMIGAMFYAAEDIDEKFKSMPYTFNQTMTMMKNAVVKGLDDIWAKLTAMLSNGDLEKFVKSFASAIITVVNIMVTLFVWAVNIYNFIASNWSWIAPIIGTIVVALLAYKAALMAVRLWNVLCSIAETIQIALLIAKTSGLRAAASATVAYTTAQWGANAALLASPITWIILAIIAVIGLIYLVIGVINNVTGKSISATGIIFGAIAWLGAMIWNIIVGIWNKTLAVIDNFVNFFIGIIEWVLNVANGGFDSFGDAVANLIGNIVSWFLSLGKVVTTIVDAIFGTDWTGGLNALSDKVTSWGKNDKAITLERNLVSKNLGGERLDLTNAFDKGKKFGEGIDKKVSGFFENDFGDLSGSFDIPTDYGLGGGAGDYGQLGKDVSDIADGVSVSNEDLKYLRQLAEQRSINKFTTAEIKIDMNNSNTINGTQDIDGIVGALEEKLYESMSVAAEGVHI